MQTLLKKGLTKDARIGSLSSQKYLAFYSYTISWYSQKDVNPTPALMMTKPVMLKKLKLNGSMKMHKTF